MQITQIRNATVMVSAGPHRILVDPMLARQGALPPLKWLTRTRRRNPLVELPAGSDALLDSATHCLITHCQKGHFDHLDSAAVRWLRQRQLPVLCMPSDADFLERKGLNAQALPAGAGGDFLGGRIRPIPCVHGRGFVGRFMAHGWGYFIEWPGEPTLYLAGDTVLTDAVRECLRDLRPQVAVLPCGGATFGVGQDIIMDIAQVLEAAAIAPGLVVANHLEALDHCPETRGDLLARAQARGLAQRVLAPLDGQTLTV